jgi:prepilin-type N-terminal cleavage/methylation domain-containing protein
MTMCKSKQQPKCDESQRGFTLIEVLISIMITLIVMASVFALLSKGQRSFQREPEIADLQQSARTVLDMVSRDVLQAGAGLPPEFPAFTRINGAGDNAPTDVIEMVGTFQLAGELYLEPEEISTGGIDGSNTVTMEAETTNFEIGDIVVVYNDANQNLLVPEIPQWSLGLVTGAVDNPGGNATVDVDYGAFDPAYSWPVGSNPPPNPGFVVGGRSPKMTRVSIVRYFTVLDNAANYNGPPPQVLMRDVDFANNPQAVGYLEDFQISYLIGVAAPVEQDNPPNPVVDLAGVPLTSENMLSSVRVTVTARSVSAGMEGATEGASGGREDDFIRKTFSTNVNPRNVSSGLEIRQMMALNAP